MSVTSTRTDVLRGYRGRLRTSLARTLDTDLKHIGMRLKTMADLEQLPRIAKTEQYKRSCVHGRCTVAATPKIRQREPKGKYYVLCT